MTGFGRGMVETAGCRYVVEARSVNHRYCEVKVQAPKDLLEFEHALSHDIKSRFSRGKFDVVLKVERFSERASVRSDDRDVIRCWKDLDRLRKQLGLKDPVSLELALERTPSENPALRVKERARMFAKASDIALRQLKAARLKEGQALLKDVLARNQSLIRMVKRIEKSVRSSAPMRLARAKDRLKQLFDEKDFSEDRLNIEMALLAEKADVTEEVVRLKSHFEQLRETCKSKEGIGRKLDFLLQEMNREINTIGAKTLDLGITNDVVQIKAEIEKIREQSQNLE